MAEVYANEDELRRTAEKRVKERVGLVWHATTYLIINFFVWAIWLIIALSTNPHQWQAVWPIWVTLGWGIGLAFHIFGYFTGMRGQSRREDQVQREMERLRDQQR